jgi:arabinose-5-phosphate isomerase
MDTDSIIAKGRRCIDIEAAALQQTSKTLDGDFASVAQTLIETIDQGNKLIFSGIGKSAHIAQKLVGTFNSIGAPSSFLDPVNALHGDMGLCSDGDALLAFSNSGETEELLRLVTLVSRFNLKTIAVTSQAEASLARLCSGRLLYSAEQEACPLDLAPTASSTACMAIGDAVAMVILEARAFSKEDFARFHPGGSLGKSLAVRVDEIMRPSGQFAQMPDTASCQDCLQRMTNPNSGCIALTDSDGKLTGVFTDGDIRRLVLSDPDFLSKTVSTFMTRNPITISSGSLAVEALRIFESRKIDDLIVVDASSLPIGVIDGQDLTKARLV